jgi:WD40 repeat protein
MRLCGTLPIGVTEWAAFHPTKKELFTAGAGGLSRWPYRIEGGSLRIGPAEKVLATPGLRQIASSADGRILALGEHHGPQILDLAFPAKEPLRCDHLLNFNMAVSPDGRWVASGQGSGHGVKVWDAQTAKCVCELLPQVRGASVVFSPDGQWLATSTGEEFSFWQTSSWQPVRRTPLEQGGHVARPLAFSRNQEMLALAISRDVVQLVHPATGGVFATLRAPDADEIRGLQFSPDGGQLIVFTLAPSRFQVWDLRLLRPQLQDLGLDWVPAPFPPPPDRRAFKPLQLEVD